MSRVKLLGYEIDSYNFEEAVSTGLELINQDKVSQVVTINPEMFDCAKENEKFSDILKTAEMVIPDGVGVKIGLKISGYNAERIAGIDFAKRMIEECSKRNISVALIGAKNEIVQRACENLKQEYENLKIAYCHDGYFSDDEEILKDLKESGARLVLVALGSPKQEFFINKAREILPYGLMIGVGGSFDVWSGAVERAPEIYQKLGMEWLYRTVTQPERFKRIFPALPLFVFKVFKEKFKQ